MSLLGDLIMTLREAATDLPLGRLPAPVLVSANPATTGGANLPLGTYNVRVTEVNQWGESISSNEIGNILVNGAFNSINVVFTGSGQSGNTFRIYFGLVPGAQQSFQSAPASPVIITANSTIVGKLPNRNSAYLPDTDGRAISATSVIRWINDGLKAAAVICGGGIPDISGVPSVAGQAMYILNGNWKKIDDAWYDGYSIGLGAKSNIYRRNKTSGLTGILAVNHVASRTIIELYPQPPRTAGATTLNGGIAATDTSLIVNANTFILPMGLALIGTEIVSFAGFNVNTMNGLIRGIGGTSAQAWPNGTAIQELNLMIAGLRVPTDYILGQAASTFNAPPGWEAPMGKYLIHRFRELEQNGREAQRLLTEFETTLKNFLSATKPIAGPVQITAGGRRGPEVAMGFGSRFGGVIIP